MVRTIAFYLSLFGFVISCLAEEVTFSITIEGTDDILLGTELNIKKIHTKLKLGGSFTIDENDDISTIKRFRSKIGLNMGYIISPKEGINLIPSVGINYNYKIDVFEWESDIAGDEKNYSYELEPILNITIYKFFKSFILGASADLAYLTYKRVDYQNWDKTSMGFTLLPKFVIGYRF